MLMFLKNEDDITISLSTLRRHLKSLGLSRQKAQSDVLDAAFFQQEQVKYMSI